ncbi:hypothetical protein V6N13_055581 [Hibiscus sabdariffa]
MRFNSNQAKAPASLELCFNGLNALSVSQARWLSLVLLFLVAVLCWYARLHLRRCMDTHPFIKTYLDIGEHAFGYKGELLWRVIMSVFMYVKLYLVAVEFLILEGDNLNKLFPNMMFKLAGMKIRGKQAFVVLTSLIVLSTTWLKSLGLLAYVSADSSRPAVAEDCFFLDRSHNRSGYNSIFGEGID